MTLRPNIFLLIAVTALSGCTLQMKWFGAGGNECEWDEINYKNYFEPAASAGQAGQSNVPEFGACSDEDLANSTCK